MQGMTRMHAARDLSRDFTVTDTFELGLSSFHGTLDVLFRAGGGLVESTRAVYQDGRGGSR